MKEKIEKLGDIRNRSEDLDPNRKSFPTDLKDLAQEALESHKPEPRSNNANRLAFNTGSFVNQISGLQFTAFDPAKILAQFPGLVR